jgi:tRNA (uracil-5-)-methyltransferase
MNVYPWILQQRCIDVQSIVSAPTPLRNKCELTFGYQYKNMFTPSTGLSLNGDVKNDKNETDTSQPMFETSTDEVITPVTYVEPIKIPAVGFMVTGWAGGVSFSNTLPNIPHEVGVIVDRMNTFLLSSPFVPYDCTTHTGFWRILTIRTSRRTKECMLIIQHNSLQSTSKNGPDSIHDKHETDETVDWTNMFVTEKERLISLLVDTDLPTESDPSSIKVTSIFFQEFSGLSNPSPEHPVQVRGVVLCFLFFLRGDIREIVDSPKVLCLFVFFMVSMHMGNHF